MYHVHENECDKQGEIDAKVRCIRGEQIYYTNTQAAGIGKGTVRAALSHVVMNDPTRHIESGGFTRLRGTVP